MRKLTTLLPAVVFAACCGSFANASTVTLEAVNGLTDSSNYYVGPYSLQVDGTRYQTMCYDFTHEATIGETWAANLYSFTDLRHAYYAHQSDYVAKYWQAAWLFTQLLDTTNPDEMVGIQHAAWALFNPDAAPVDAAAPWLAASADAFENHYDALDLTGYRVVNEIAEQPSVQGFIINGYPRVVTQDADAPEAASYLMLGAGLMCFGLFAKRVRLNCPGS